VPLILVLALTLGLTFLFPFGSRQGFEEVPYTTNPEHEARVHRLFPFGPMGSSGVAILSVG